MLLSVSNLFSSRQHGEFQIRDASFLQQPYQKIAIAGETGSGKTTLMKMIAGLTQPESGTIIFEDKKVRGPDFQLIPGQEGTAYLSQHFELRHHYRMEELLEYANKLPAQYAENIYRVCRIDHLMKRKSDQLSGGEKQRVALARLLVGTPRLLLLDEPFSNLDLIHKNILKAAIEDISSKMNITCLLTSHDPADTLSWADEIIVLQNGSIIQKGTPQEIYTAPINEYCAALFGEYNIINASNANKFGLPGNADVLIRPEKIILSNNTGKQGKIINVKFCGHYWRTEIQIESIKLISYTPKRIFAPGDPAYISFQI